ncbi:DDE superfamily endonuclease [Ceratobasidium sp. AG-Ba]|nr:DDE superfamily endonuclease [Ceratobasidium sp. AG-Ba]
MPVLSTLAHQQDAFTNLLSDICDVLEFEEHDLDDSENAENEHEPSPRKPLDLSSLDTDEWLILFRFGFYLRQKLLSDNIPTRVLCDNGVSEPAKIALLMLLRRLSYPARYIDLFYMFGWEKSRFSRVTRTLAAYLYRRWAHILYFDPHRLNRYKLADYAAAVHARGAALKNVWGFVDGTLRRTTRPVRNQRIIYNGWKRIHALKFHSICTPDGIHSHLFGPIEGRRHDATVYEQSNLERILELYSYAPDNSPLVVYGDPAYGLSSHLISPFKGSNLSADELRFNLSMSKVREAVEWSFGEVIRQFAFLDFYKNQKVLLQPVGIFYAVGILLTNAHVILHGSQVSKFFDCPPPLLEEYFHGTAADAKEAQERGYTVEFTDVIPGVLVTEDDLGDGEQPEAV